MSVVMKDAFIAELTHRIRMLHYRGYAITLRAIGDGQSFTAGYSIRRPDPDVAFSAFFEDGFPDPEAALDHGETRARQFVDYLLDKPPSERQPGGAEN